MENQSRKQRIIRRAITISVILSTITVTIGSAFILFVAWRELNNVPPTATFYLSGVGGFLGGLAYVFLYSFAEAGVKLLWRKFKKLNQTKLPEVKQ
jgi:hypothetical protein